MKKLLLFSFIATAGFAANAQELAPDQNPNYKTSLAKYTGSAESLQSTMNTTVQDTYKAYDWSTARSERRAENREDRRYYNTYNNDYYNNNGYYNNGYYDNGYDYNYSPNYNYGYSPYASPYQHYYYHHHRRH